MLTDAQGFPLAFTPSARERVRKLKWLQALAEEHGTGCRDWPWAVNNRGYAMVRWEGKVRKAGHVILEMVGRPRPSPGLMQLHSCDRPVCVAPWHLRWGTSYENRRECIDRGRQVQAEGADNGLAKLTDEKVRAIRAARGKTTKELAAEYGVHRTVIGKIRNGRIWRHLLEESA